MHDQERIDHLQTDDIENQEISESELLYDVVEELLEDRNNPRYDHPRPVRF